MTTGRLGHRDLPADSGAADQLATILDPAARLAAEQRLLVDTGRLNALADDVRARIIKRLGAAPATDVLKIAAGQLGYMECRDVGHTHRDRNHTKFGAWFGLDGNAWCAMFVSWVEAQTGQPYPVTSPKGYAYTPSGVQHFRQAGRWHTTPRPGDHGFLYYPSLGRVGHVFLVRRVEGDTVVTLEGNTNSAGSREGGVVASKRRKIADVYGFGRPPRTAAQEDWLEMATLQEVEELLARKLRERPDVGTVAWGDVEKAGRNITRRVEPPPARASHWHSLTCRGRARGYTCWLAANGDIVDLEEFTIGAGSSTRVRGIGPEHPRAGEIETFLVFLHEPPEHPVGLVDHYRER